MFWMQPSVRVDLCRSLVKNVQRAHAYTCARARTRVHTHMYMCTHKHEQTHPHTCTHTHTYTHTHTRTHMLAHIHTDTHSLSCDAFKPILPNAPSVKLARRMHMRDMTHAHM